MGCGFGKCATIAVNEQLIITNFTDRKLINGPKFIQPYDILASGTVVQQRELKLNEYVLVTNTLEPSETRCEYGPDIIRLNSPWEYFGNIEKCPILDQDDYMTVTNPNGEKFTFRGPAVFKPRYGQIFGSISNAVIVPINHYIVIKDNNDTNNPIKHIRGPTKFIPEPYQTFVSENPNTNSNTILYKCIEITELKAIHLKKADGNVVLLDTPMYYMPNVGESIVCTVDKIVMLTSDFCIVKGPNGACYILDGQNGENRSFFLKPFHSLLGFKIGNEEKTVLSVLPSFIPHKFTIRTNDNVLMVIDLRISYQICSVKTFGSGPIPFYEHIINWCQNELLDVFAKLSLRDFMRSYSTVALDSIHRGSDYFIKFGIGILDIQIIGYTCQDKRTQELLDTDIQTNVKNQNDLKIQEADIVIKQKQNLITQQHKDLEITLAHKDIEVELKKQEMSVLIAEKQNEIDMKKKELDVNLRLVELRLQIDEENKKTELLDIKRCNAVKEGEYEGRAQGSSVNEFLKSIENVDMETKIELWNRLRDLEKTAMLYTKVDKINMYPPNADAKFFQFDSVSVSDMDKTKDSIVRTVALPDILNYNHGQRK